MTLLGLGILALAVVAGVALLIIFLVRHHSRRRDEASDLVTAAAVTKLSREEIRTKLEELRPPEPPPEPDEQLTAMCYEVAAPERPPAAPTHGPEEEPLLAMCYSVAAPPPPEKDKGRK